MLLMIERYTNNYFCADFEGNLFLVNKSHVAASMHLTDLMCILDDSVYGKVTYTHNSLGIQT